MAMAICQKGRSLSAPSQSLPSCLSVSHVLYIPKQRHACMQWPSQSGKCVLTDAVRSRLEKKRRSACLNA